MGVVESTGDNREFGIFFGDGIFEGIGVKEPLVEHFLYRNDTITISAETGVGKTMFILQLLLCCTTGTPFLDAYAIPNPLNVLLLQTEGDRAETVNRIKAMRKGIPFNQHRCSHLILDGVCLNTIEGLNKFLKEAAIPKLVYDVIIIDPLYTTVKGSLSSDDVVTEWIRSVRSIRHHYPGCGIIIVHHESSKSLYTSTGTLIPKGPKDLMGSTYWGANNSYNYKLTVNKEGLYTLMAGKTRNENAIDKVEMKLLSPAPLMFVLAETDGAKSSIQIMKLLLEAEEPLYCKKIIKDTGLSKSTVFRVLNQLERKGKVKRIERDGISHFYIEQAQDPEAPEPKETQVIKAV